MTLVHPTTNSVIILLKSLTKYAIIQIYFFTFNYDYI